MKNGFSMWNVQMRFSFTQFPLLLFQNQASHNVVLNPETEKFCLTSFLFPSYFHFQNYINFNVKSHFNSFHVEDPSPTLNNYIAKTMYISEK